MWANYYHKFIVGYWRCHTADFIFDYYIRHDGFHIGLVPWDGADGGRLTPMPLWLKVETASEIQVTTKQKSSWARSYYRDGNRLVMWGRGDPSSLSVSYPIRGQDLSEDGLSIIRKFNDKY